MARKTQTITLSPFNRGPTGFSQIWGWPNGPSINADLRSDPDQPLRIRSFVVGRTTDTFAAITLDLESARNTGGDMSNFFERNGSVTLTHTSAGTITVPIIADTSTPYTFINNNGALSTWISTYVASGRNTFTMLFDDNDFKTDLNSITQEMVISRPNGQKLTYAEPFPAAFTFDYGARNRTRVRGTIWEWNDDDLTLPPLFVTDATRVLNRLRVGADRIQITDAEGNDPGFSDLFEADGLFHVTSPGVGTVTIADYTISNTGRFNPGNTTPEWDAWWTAFSADATNELSIRFEILGPEIELAVGRVDGVTALIGEPLAISQVQAVGRPYTFREATPVAQENDLGRPRGYIPAVAAQPIAQEQSLSRPHAFSHAEFIQTDLSVSRPIAQVKRAVQPIAQDQVLGQAASVIFGVPGSINPDDIRDVFESAGLGARTLVRSNGTWQFNVASSPGLFLPEPIFSSGASGIIQAHLRADQLRFIAQGGRNPGFSREFMERGMITWRNVGGSDFTVVGPQFDSIGRLVPTPDELDGYDAWWTEFSADPNSNLLIRWDITTTGFQPFLSYENAVGQVDGRSSLVGEPIQIVNELATSRPHAFAHAEFIQTDMAVGRPGVSTTRAIQPIITEQITSRPHGFAHAEFIQTDMVVGRPGVSTTRAIRPITLDQVVERADGVKKHFAVGLDIIYEQDIGRPRGYITKVAAGGILEESLVATPIGLVKRSVLAISLEQGVGNPQPYAHGAGVIEEQVLGRPRGYIQAVAAISITNEQATSRPHAFAHAEFIQTDLSVGKVIALVRRAIRAIAQTSSVGKPHTLRAVEPIILENATGRPRGYTAEVAAKPITIEQVVPRPSSVIQAVCRPIVFEQETTKPIAQVKRAVLAITQNQVVGRPHTLAHGVGVIVEQVVSRPNAFVKRAVRRIILRQRVRRPIGERKRIAFGQPIVSVYETGKIIVLVKRAIDPITNNQITGRPAAVLSAQARPVVSIQQTGRPRGYSESVAAFPVIVEHVLNRPPGLKLRIGVGIPIVNSGLVGMPRGYIEAMGNPVILNFVMVQPQRYFPRRNPVAQAAADYTVEAIATTVSAQAIISSTNVEAA